ncbi:MAG: hypothetical protein QXH27_04170 [Candidatus Micrarchaeia archaeon]
MALKARDPPATRGRVSSLAQKEQAELKGLARSPSSDNRFRDFFWKLLTDERGSVPADKLGEAKAKKKDGRARVPPDFVELEKKGEFPPLTVGDALNYALIICGKFSNKEEDKEKAQEAELELKTLRSQTKDRVAGRFLRAVIPLIEASVHEIGKLQTGVDARLKECEENKQRIIDFLNKFEFSLKSIGWQTISARIFSITLSGTALAALHAWSASHLGVFAPVADAVLAFLAFVGGEAIIKSAVIAGSAAAGAYYNWKRERITNLGKHFGLNGMEKEAGKTRVLKVLIRDVMEKIEEFYPRYAEELAKKYGKEKIEDGVEEHIKTLEERLKVMDGRYYLNLPQNDENKNA